MTIEELFSEWMELSAKLYPDTTAEACIIHAVNECCEAAKEFDETKAAIEVWDAIFCLLTFCKKRKISMQELMDAGIIKFNINKSRKWKQNADKTYSHL